MAVENKYVDANLAAGKKAKAGFAFGDNAITLRAIATVAAADDDGSKYRLFKGLPSNLIPVNICIQNPVITAGTDYDLGLFKVGLDGAAVEPDVLANGISMGSARTIATWNNAGMTDVALADAQKTLGALSGQANPDEAYDLVLTANTVGSADGAIVVTATFLQG
jgi:hypothetical protein